MGAQFESESAAFLANATEWPDFDGYQPIPIGPDSRYIRLLNVAFDPCTRQIQCHLTKHELGSMDGGEDYFALSYYWGAPGMKRDILVDGTTVFLRKNVYDFLKAIGRRFTTLSVWLDVLCINQKDTRERNQQIGLMHEIFSGAKCVFSWLGKGDADTELLLKTLSDIGDSDIANYTAALHDAQSYLSATKLLDYAERLLTYPYFSRVWVVQECALAQDLYLFCSSRSIDRQSFVRGVRQILRVEESLKMTPHQEGKRRRDVLKRSMAVIKKRIEHRIDRRPNLLGLMEVYRFAKCVDPRDKIYGYRALCREMDLIKVDYSRSKTFVFLQALSVINWPPDTDTISSSMTDSFLNIRLACATDLMKHLPVAPMEIYNGLQEIYGELAQGSRSVQPGIGLSSRELVSSLKGAIEKPYMATDLSHPCELDLICTRCTRAGCAVRFYSKTQPKPGMLVHRVLSVGFDTLSLALVVRRSPQGGDEIFDVGILYQESLYDETEVSRWLREKDQAHMPPAYQTFLHDSAFMSHWTDLQKLALRCGFELCETSDHVHLSPVMLFALMSWTLDDPLAWSKLWSEDDRNWTTELLRRFSDELRTGPRGFGLCHC